MRCWMASPTWWTWVSASFKSRWWTGKPGVLQSMGSQRVEQDWETELNWKHMWMVGFKVIFTTINHNRLVYQICFPSFLNVKGAFGSVSYYCASWVFCLKLGCYHTGLIIATYNILNCLLGPFHFHINLSIGLQTFTHIHIHTPARIMICVVLNLWISLYFIL